MQTGSFCNDKKKFHSQVTRQWQWIKKRRRKNTKQKRKEENKPESAVCGGRLPAVFFAPIIVTLQLWDVVNLIAKEKGGFDKLLTT